MKQIVNTDIQDEFHWGGELKSLAQIFSPLLARKSSGLTRLLLAFFGQKWPFDFYASAPKVPEALCFRVVRPSVRPDLHPDFFVYAITQVLLDGISSNLVQGSRPGVDELIRFWARSAQRQGSKVNELVLNMLFFPVYAITQVLLDGISSNLVQGCTTWGLLHKTLNRRKLGLFFT